MDISPTIDTQVILPMELYQAIAQRAQARGHSVSGEIVAHCSIKNFAEEQRLLLFVRDDAHLRSPEFEVGLLTTNATSVVVAPECAL